MCWKKQQWPSFLLGVCPKRGREPGVGLGWRRGKVGAWPGWLGLQEDRRVDGAEQRGVVFFAGGRPLPAVVDWLFQAGCCQSDSAVG